MRTTALGLGLFASMAMSVPASAQDYSGVTVEILTRPGPVIAQRLVERGEEFTAMTGAEIRVNEVPFAELFQKILTDWATGTNSIDVGVFASGWATELVDGGLVEPLDDYIANDDKINVDDIAPYFREFNQKIGGKTYLITVDGDFQMLYYRRKTFWKRLGLSRRRPGTNTWKLPKRVHGKDMNGDGEGDFGSCIFKKRNAQSYFAMGTIAASYVQTKGTGEGIFFNTDDMTPKINNEAWQEAFRIYKATGEAGPPDELNHDIGDTRALVQSGRCALTIDWGDIGPLSIGPDGAAIKDKMYASISPGTTKALNVETGKLEACNPDLARTRSMVSTMRLSVPSVAGPVPSTPSRTTR